MVAEPKQENIPLCVQTTEEPWAGSSHGKWAPYVPTRKGYCYCLDVLCSLNCFHPFLFHSSPHSEPSSLCIKAAKKSKQLGSTIITKRSHLNGTTPPPLPVSPQSLLCSSAPLSPPPPPPGRVRVPASSGPRRPTAPPSSPAPLPGERTRP
jgi:hypothetical protein